MHCVAVIFNWQGELPGWNIKRLEMSMQKAWKNEGEKKKRKEKAYLVALALSSIHFCITVADRSCFRFCFGLCIALLPSTAEKGGMFTAGLGELTMFWGGAGHRGLLEEKSSVLGQQMMTWVGISSCSVCSAVQCLGQSLCRRQSSASDSGHFALGRLGTWKCSHSLGIQETAFGSFPL